MAISGYFCPLKVTTWLHHATDSTMFAVGALMGVQYDRNCFFVDVLTALANRWGADLDGDLTRVASDVGFKISQMYADSSIASDFPAIASDLVRRLSGGAHIRRGRDGWVLTWICVPFAPSSLLEEDYLGGVLTDVLRTIAAAAGTNLQIAGDQ